MSVSPDVAIAIVTITIQICAVVVAWIGIVHANRRSVQESEHRISTRIGALEVSNGMLAAKVERAEKDIQSIWHEMPKREKDKPHAA